MSNFGPIAYEDFSQLNARWNEARPAVAGLGFLPAHVDAEYVRRACAGGRCKGASGLGIASGQHDYVDLSFLNAHYRPIWPAQVGMSNGILSSNSLGIAAAGMGADPSYPWREYSADTKALQQATNEALRAHGYTQITADGKLGPATCGAIRKMCDFVDTECDAPATCQEFTSPSLVGSGGGLIAKKPATAPVSRAGMFGGGGSPNWLLIGGAVAALAVGGALIYKASKK